MRQWIARMLAPKAFRDAERYARLRREIEMSRQWLAFDFPEVGAFAEYLVAGDRNYWRSLDEKPVESRWYGDISQFREQLRRGEASPTAPTTT